MPAGVNAQAAGIPMSDAMGTCKVNAVQLYGLAFVRI